MRRREQFELLRKHVDFINRLIILPAKQTKMDGFRQKLEERRRKEAA